MRGEKYSQEIDKDLVIELIDEGKKADLVKLWNAMETLLCSEHAKNELENVIGDYVEFIPARYKTETFYIIRILYNLNAVDYKHSKFEQLKTGLIVGLKEYAFLERIIKDIPIFKLRLNNKIYSTEIFVTSCFKERIEERKLTGFVFIKVWDSEKKRR